MTSDDVRAIAAMGHVDERTVLRVLVGLPVRGKAGKRAERALKAFLARGRKDSGGGSTP
jgi:hypothetical protein